MRVSGPRRTRGPRAPGGPRRTSRRGIGRRLVSLVTAVVAGVACGPPGGPPVDDDAVAPAFGDRVRIAYADHSDGFGDLWLPGSGNGSGTEAPDAPWPVVVLIHGGFWRDGYFLDLMDPLVPSLLDAGFAVWNIEYRRVGAGGGDPETFEDVAAAVDRLDALPPSFDGLLDTSRVATVGHSAGGHLAVWAASRPSLSDGVAGADPVVVPDTAIAQAGVLDLVGCARDGVGGTACTDLLGASPVDDPELARRTSPADMVPVDARVVAVHGDLDRIVPLSQSVTYVDRAVEAGMDAELIVVEGADHFVHLDPDGPAWAAVLAILTEKKWQTE